MGSTLKSLGFGALEERGIFLTLHASEVTDAVEGEELRFLELISSENTFVESLRSAFPGVLCLSCHASVKLLKAKTLFRVGLKLPLSLKVC